jgi:tetratricopeptide (TPR) repeat protein
MTLGLAALTAFVYGPLARHEFVNVDDPQYVSENPNVAAGLTWRSVGWAFTTGYAGNWHPLTWLSHALDLELFGLNPGAHHLINVLLHAVNTVLLFGWLRAATSAVGASGFAAALFAVHPLHVESVAWVAERKDVLSTFFWMLTLRSYSAYVRRPRVSRYTLVLLVLALGLMAKPMLVTVPFVLLLLDVWPLDRIRRGSPAGSPEGRRHASRAEDTSLVAQGFSPARLTAIEAIREKLPLIALAIASIIVTFVAQQQGGAVKGLDVLPLGRRLSNAIVAYVTYAGKMIWPTGLAAIYPYPASYPAWLVLGCATGLIAVTIAVIRAARRHPYLPVGWLWYVGTLVPVIGLVQVGGQPFADRYTYVPFIGLFIMVGWGAPRLAARLPHRRIVLAAAATAATIGCVIAASSQVHHWRSSLTLWEHAIAATRDNYRAHHNLGHALADLGRVDEAIAQYRVALGIKPEYPEAHNNLGSALADVGKPDEAVAHYLEALRIMPEYVEARVNLGVALSAQGNTDEAIRHFSLALEQDSRLAPAHNNLGLALAARGRLDDAIAHYTAAVGLDPSDPEPRNNLGVALAGQSRFDEAIARYREALGLDPHYVAARINLGHALASQRRSAEAVAEYSGALRLEPGNPLAHNGLGAALADQGRVDEARRHYAEAVRLAPGFADPHSNLGRILAAEGRIDEALREFLEALRLKPDDAGFHYDVAAMLARKGRLDEAVRHLEATIRLDPGHQAARLVLKQIRGVRR